MQRISSNESNSECNNDDAGLLFDLGSYDYDEYRSTKKAIETHRGLTWRADPEESLSDWTILILPEEGGYDETKATIYHVHRYFLGAGDRRSEYFTGLFRSSCMSETTTSTSRITLSDAAAEAVPEMLDHMYTGECRVDGGNAVALRWLSRYFGVRTLFHAASDFIKKDLGTSNAHDYLSAATRHGDDKVAAAATGLCASHFNLLTKDQIGSFSPDHLRFVLTDARLDVPSETLSVKIADYCRTNPSRVDGAFLASVTDPGLMPAIHPSEALFLLDLWVTHHERRSSTDETANTSLEDGTTSLRSRCARAMHDWKTAFEDSVLARKDVGDRKNETSNNGGGYSNLPNEIKVELLEAALVCASEDIIIANDDLFSAKELSTQLSKEKSHLSLQVLNLKATKTQLEIEFQQLSREWKKMNRLPNQESMLVRSDNGTADRIGCSGSYGYGHPIAPSKMPCLAYQNVSDTDGMLFARKDNAHQQTLYCPVYYYVDDA